MVSPAAIETDCVEWAAYPYEPPFMDSKPPGSPEFTFLFSRKNHKIATSWPRSSPLWLPIMVGRCPTRLLRLSLFSRLWFDVRGDAQVLPLSVGVHLREIILFHKMYSVTAEQQTERRIVAWLTTA